MCKGNMSTLHSSGCHAQGWGKSFCCVYLLFVCLFKCQMFQQLLVLYLMLRFLNILHIADENICYNFCTDLFCLYGM